MHLGDVGDIGLVIADKPRDGTAEENKWLAASLDLTNHGTEYIEPDKIVLPIVTAHSHHVPHLQLADLIVAATTAAYWPGQTTPPNHPHRNRPQPGPYPRLAHRNTPHNNPDIPDRPTPPHHSSMTE